MVEEGFQSFVTSEAVSLQTSIAELLKEPWNVF